MVMQMAVLKSLVYQHDIGDPNVIVNMNFLMFYLII